MGAGRSRLTSLGELDALILASAIWFLGKSVRYAFPPLFGTFRTSYGVSNTTLGLLFTAMMVAYAAMQFPSGAVADRVGRVRVITGGVLVLSAGAFLLAGTQTFVALVVAAVLLGIGSGAHKTVAITLVSAVYPRRTGRTLGVMDAIGDLGGVAAPAAVVFVLTAAVGWPVIFLAVGVAGVALAAAFAARVPGRLPDDSLGTGDGSSGGGGRGRGRDRDRDRDEGGSRGGGVGSDSTVGTYRSSFAEPRFAVFVAVVVAFAFAWNGMTAFLPLYLQSAKGVSAARAGVLFAALFATSLVQPVSGALGDRIGQLPVVAGAMALAGGSLALLLGASHPVAVAALVAALGLGGHAFRPVRDAYLARAIPEAVGGGVLGAVRSIMMGAAAAAPAVIGYLSEAASFGVAFGVLTAAIGLAVAPVLVMVATARD